MSKAEQCKARANEAFKAQDFEGAIAGYSGAIQADPTNPVYFSNRAMAYLKVWPLPSSPHGHLLQVEAPCCPPSVLIDDDSGTVVAFCILQVTGRNVKFRHKLSECLLQRSPACI